MRSAAFMATASRNAPAPAAQEDRPQQDKQEGPAYIPPSPSELNWERYVTIGMDVLYYAGANQGTTPYNAKVEAVENEQLTLLVWTQSRIMRELNVRHMSDPRLSDSRLARWGGWDFVQSPERMRIKGLEQEVAELNELVNALVAQMPTQGNAKPGSEA